MTTLMAQLLDEISRNEQLVLSYDDIPTGAFGAILIRQDLADAKAAISNGDTVEMIRLYLTLQENK